MHARLAVALLLALALALAACTDDGEEQAEPELPDDPAADDIDVGEADAPPTADDEVAQAPAGGNGLLQTVTERGELWCGVHDALPGFGIVDADGDFQGFDIDFCRVIAAAVLGDAEAVRYLPIAVADRFTALQAGEIDVLVRNTTWTATRDGAQGAAFATTTYYDGQGMMVRTGEFDSIEQMTNTVICVLEGTTTELNLAGRFAGIPYEPQTFPTLDDLQDAFVAGACDGWTSDLSQLAARRASYPEGPEALTILDDIFSKEPLGPAVLDGDQQWFDAVNWAVIATIQAEEFGISSDNVADFEDSEDASVLRFLGLPFEQEEGAAPTVFDPGLGLPTDFARQIVEQVGNYGEIFERNLGSGTPLGLERGVNRLWTEGGLLYAPPYV